MIIAAAYYHNYDNKLGVLSGVVFFFLLLQIAARGNVYVILEGD
jgi:hypothetical protein